MRCLGCEYDLKNLTSAGGGEHRCPECGRGFDPEDFSTFRVDMSRQPRIVRWPLAIWGTLIVLVTLAVFMIPFVNFVAVIWRMLFGEE